MDMKRSSFSACQNVFCLLGSFLTTLSVQGLWSILPDSGTPGMGGMYQLNALLDGLGSAYNQSWLSWLALAVFFFFAYRTLYFRGEKLRIRIFSVFLGLSFTLFFLIGASMEKYGAFEPVLSGKLQLALLALSALGYFLPLMGFFYRLPTWLPALFAVRWAPAEKLAQRVQAKRPLWGPVLFFVLCWLPVWIIAFPGGLASDTGTQLGMFLPENIFNNHYPYLVTLFYIGVSRLGMAIGQPWLALLLLTAMQYFWQAFALGYLMRTLQRLGMNDTFRGICMVLFGIVTIWPIYAVCVQKDTLYNGGIVLLLCLCAELLYAGRELTPRLTAALFALGLLVLHTRNNGIYLCLPLFAALALALGRRSLCKIGAAALAMLAVFAVTQGPLMAAVHCYGNETQEMLSVPFQQTARFVKQYPDEVTPDEEEAIDTVLIYETLADRYEPYMSDAVKMQYRLRYYNGDDPDYEKVRLQHYFKAWAAQFQRHPLVYFEATANNMYGFIAPISYRVLGPVELNIDVDPALEHSVADYNQPACLAPIRTLYAKLSTFIGKLPFISLLYSPYVTTWIVCTGAVLLLRKKCWRAMVLYLPALINVAVCLVSPINGSTRYMLCATAALPLLLAVLAHEPDSHTS